MDTCFICGCDLSLDDEVVYIISGNGYPAHVECAEIDYPDEVDQE